MNRFDQARLEETIAFCDRVIEHEEKYRGRAIYGLGLCGCAVLLSLLFYPFDPPAGRHVDGIIFWCCGGGFLISGLLLFQTTRRRRIAIEARRHFVMLRWVDSWRNDSFADHHLDQAIAAFNRL